MEKSYVLTHCLTQSQILSRFFGRVWIQVDAQLCEASWKGKHTIVFVYILMVFTGNLSK